MKISKYGFTLVELIVVITILAILGTITFISLLGYSSDARDSLRINDIKKIELGLGLFYTQAGKYALPDDYVNITASGEILTYQGYAGERTLRVAKISGEANDPTTSSYYTYSTNKNLSKFQLLGFLESANTSTTPIIQNYLGKSIRLYPFSRGENVGILLSDSNNLPIQNISLGVDLKSTTDNFTLYNNNDSIINGDGDKIFSSIYNLRGDLITKQEIAYLDKNLVGYWDMNTTTMSGSKILLKDFSDYGNNGICNNNLTSVNCGESLGPVFSKGVMTFDGIDDRIVVPNNSSLQLSDELTLIVGFNYTGSGTDIGFLSAKGWENYEMHTNGGTLEYGLKFFAKHGCDLFSVDNLYSSGETNISAMTFDSNGSFKAYFNGKVISGANCTSGLLIDSNDFLIGSRPGFQYFNGDINYVRLYNRALSQDEILSLGEYSN